MRIGFCELEDPRISQATCILTARGFDVCLIGASTDPDNSPAKNDDEHLSDSGHSIYREQAYIDAIRQLRNGNIDTLILGAQVPLAPALSIIFREYETNRHKALLCSTAPVLWSGGRDFLFVDPCVVVNPVAAELAVMTQRAIRLAQTLFNRPSYACVLSHATGAQRRVSSLLYETIALIAASSGADSVCPHPLQLDAALMPEAARIKVGQLSRTPNVLVCPDIRVANLLYKCLEVFVRDRVQLSGAILTGLPRGYIGLLPRTVRLDEIVRLANNLSTLFRHPLSLVDQ